MSSTTTKLCCIVCGKENTVLKCADCWQTSHGSQSTTQKQATAKTSNEGTMNQDTSTEEKVQAQQTALIEQVNSWEREAMGQIRQMTEDIRSLIVEYKSDDISQITTNLTKLNDQLRQCYQENSSIAQTVIQKYNESMIESLAQENAISTLEEPEVSNEALLFIPNIHAKAKWIQNGVTVAGGNGKGKRLNQLTGPRDIHIYDDDDQTIYVTDQMNHRIMEWKSGAASGQVVAGGNGQGNRSNQLTYPTAAILHKGKDSLIVSDFNNHRVLQWPRGNATSGETITSDVLSFGMAIDSYGHLYICEYDKHAVIRWKIGETHGTIVAGGNGQGYGLDQLNNPIDLFIDRDRSLYISDGGNHRVVKWENGATEGTVVAGGHGQGNSLAQLAYPRGVIVDQLGTIYVADFTNNRIMRWIQGATVGDVIAGDNGKGAQPNQLNGCWDIDFDREGNLFVSDSNNHRIQKFDIDSGSLQ